MSETDSVLPRRNSGRTPEAQFGAYCRAATLPRRSSRNKKLLMVKPESRHYVYNNHRRAVR
ncbi:MAG TPA: hypothetical protein GXX65_09085 [Methanosarcina sp.]|nr:hypothetical protein [Methanosarcina sp.]